MPLYVVQWKYVSSYGGLWMKGEKIDLDPDLAVIINRDSPGVLKLFKPKPVDPEPVDPEPVDPEPVDPEPETAEREQPPKQDRQQKPKATRKGEE